MEHKMRRFKQLLNEEDAKKILAGSTSGVLSLVDAEGQAYGVPLSFAYDGVRSLYFHSAVNGYKIEAIRTHPQGSFCIIAQDEIKPEEFTTYFRSVIVQGALSIVKELEEIIKGLRLLGDKYAPGIDSSSEIAKSLAHVLVFKMEIESITGKEAIELARERKEKN